MQQLENKVAVVTGGASGIGRAMADRFAAAGMKLMLADIETGPLDAAAAEIRATGAAVATSITDVSDAAAVDALAQATLDAFGAAHVICNNAGVASPPGPIWAATLADWEFTFGANLWGVIHGVRSFAPILLEQNEGHFVNTASMAGLVNGAGMGAYNVSKNAVVSISETLFEDLRAAESEVGVSVLCPAFVQSQIWNSERNRPDALQNAPEEAAEVDESRRGVLRGVIESAMPADRVANAVHDAIVGKQLYILTHESTPSAVERRMTHIVNGTNPTPAITNLADLQK